MNRFLADGLSPNPEGEKSWIDVHVYLGQWPFRRLHGDEPSHLVELLRKAGVTQAWAGNFEGLLHRDMAGVNQRLTEQCRRVGDHFLLPFGTVHPLLPDWEEDLRRCREIHGMRGLRLYPQYHQYSADQQRIERVCELAERHNLILQVVLSLEDQRTQHPLVQVAPADPTPWIEQAAQRPRLQLVLLNLGRGVRMENLDQIGATANIQVDFANWEGVGGLTHLLERVTVDRIVFGSHTPLFAFASASLKLREAAIAGQFQEAIKFSNAQRLLEATVR